MKEFMVVGKDTNGNRVDRIMEDEDMDTAIANFKNSFQSSTKTTQFIRIKIAELDDNEDNFHHPVTYR